MNDKINIRILLTTFNKYVLYYTNMLQRSARVPEQINVGIATGTNMS